MENKFKKASKLLSEARAIKGTSSAEIHVKNVKLNAMKRTLGNTQTPKIKTTIPTSKRIYNIYLN